MARILLTLAGASVLLASVAACTAQPTSSVSSTAPSAPAPAPAPANTRTYSKADIASILGAVNTQLKLRGTVETTDGPQTGAVDSLSAAISQTPRITPATCANLIKSDAQFVSELGAQGVAAGTLSSSQLTLIATTKTGGTPPATLGSVFTTNQRAILTMCKHLTIEADVDGQKVSATVDFTPLPVKTNADHSIGFRESYRITEGGGGATSTRTILEAIDGPLLIFVSGVSVQDRADLEHAVNAVVAAARA